MTDLNTIFQRLCLAFCIFAPIAIVAALGAVALWKRGTSAARRSWVRVAFAAALALPAIYLGATKRGTVTVSDDYIADAGSYLTNDIVHVAISKKTQVLPDDTEILVYARELSQSNATDWVRLSPHLTFADHPYDYALVNATNYNVMVAASFTPTPTVHTNGVWVMRGFEIPNQPGKYAFGNSKIAKREAHDYPYKYQVEYLQSTGTQYINTGIPGQANYEYRITAAENACRNYAGLLGVAWAAQSIFVQTGPSTTLGAYWHGMTSPRFDALDAKVSFAFGNGYKIVNGVKTTTDKNINQNTGLNVLVLGPAQDKYYCACKVYDFSIADSSDNLLIDLIPVIDWEDVACFYDRVTKSFFYNAGSGTFTAGPRVN